jgi:hypothetical protein
LFFEFWFFFLPLTLLEAWVLLVNYIQLTLSANNFAVNATLFDGCSNFHFFKLLAASGTLQAGYFICT